MNEKEIRAIFKRLRKALDKGEQPDKADLLVLAEGALVNLSKLAR
jgi:hypothetical protein